MNVIKKKFIMRKYKKVEPMDIKVIDKFNKLARKYKYILDSEIGMGKKK